MVGETIGSYRILKQLGAGAMGQVYLAEHRHLKRQAALKLLARELVDRPDLLERFFLEARATSAIAHPGIVQIFDCEIDATGRPYIVMELLTGETLAAVLARQGALQPLVVARLVRSLADALEAAHGKGIVHRDLKPDNMFVQREPPDSIKLVDFGIAKLAGDLQAGQVHKTRSGAVMGTPLYMSPEQCRDSAAIDFRTDLYSLGCVMHEMLTGRPPFTKDNFGELMVAHLTEAPPDARATNPAVPAPLAELTLELLRKDPARRPASMRVVSERLQGYVARMTTVPGAASAGSTGTPAGSLGAADTAMAASTSPSGPPPAGVVRTTFGASASEVDADAPARPRSAMKIGAVVALVAGAAVAAAFVLKRGPEGSPAAPPPVAAVPSPASAHEPAPSPGPAPSAGRANGPAAREPAVAETPPSSSTKKKHEHAAVHQPAAHEPPALAAAAQEAAAPMPVEPAAPTTASVELPGTWEGPWTDHAHGQEGRLFLQLAPSGSVAGWMTNTAAKQSFRMSGGFTPAGALDLACQCPPGQEFVARGAVHADAEGALKGDLTLSAPSGVFGVSRVNLRRSAGR
jgi:serine/threonine-protein kinase